jgi:hypothetical protein
MQKGKVTGSFLRFPCKSTTAFKIIIPLFVAILLFSALTVPLFAALSPARDLTGTWKNAIPELL